MRESIDRDYRARGGGDDNDEMMGLGKGGNRGAKLTSLSASACLNRS